jgi:hypothetical protein
MAAVDHDRVAGDEGGGGAGEVDDRADHVLGHLVTLNRAGLNRRVAELLDHLGVLADAVRHREPGRDAVDTNAIGAELLRERARERHDRTLARHVVEEEGHAAKRRPGGDVDYRAAARLAHRGHCRPAREEHRGDVDVHHPAPLLERDLGERPHLQRRVEAGVVDQHVE